MSLRPDIDIGRSRAKLATLPSVLSQMLISTSARAFASVLAIITWSGLAVQFHASAQNLHTVPLTLWVMARYFTIVANFCVAMICIAMAIGRPRISSSVLACMVLAIMLVGIIYTLLLRGQIELSGGAELANLILHGAIPALFPLFWLIFAPKGRLRWRDPAFWAMLPLAYFLYALTRAQFDGIYPYPFMNAATLGWQRTTLNALLIATGFIGVGYALVWLDRRLAEPAR